MPASHPVVPAGFPAHLCRWQQLVAPAWVAGLLADTPIAAAPAASWRLLEVGYGTRDAFLRDHIPQADYLDTTELEQAPVWNKVPDDALLRLLLGHGIRHDTTVILYSRDALAAARAAQLMLYAGVGDVRLLDGGYAGWRRLGLPVACGAAQRCRPAIDFGTDFPARPEYLTDMHGARQLLHQAGGTLVSIRTWKEFIGATSGYSYIPACGGIAGARWGHAGAGDDVNSMSAFQHPDGTMRAAGGIARRWAANSIGPERNTVFYCGTGWRASLAFFYAWLMAWPNISVYDGGWCEWSRDPDNPVICRIAASGDATAD
ncbi:3-mercaptopyruvate sulfurtransferase SseA [Actimicrobium sp. GrIS 1.19]|uniref:sulfurtransferase n=1 Tax=Actimicrobium sp. GrIS 1.19 TaxID=3071708 RepID=UPI002E0B5C93|nr:3-mercaptopyruvate sulfurtransferase SseA [Actimicrobium sp. GrIS 1.19]